MKGLRKTKERVLGLALALVMIISVIASGNMLEVKAETSSRTIIDSVTLDFDWTKFESSEITFDYELDEFWVTTTGTGMGKLEDPYRYLLVKPTQAHVNAGYITSETLANVGSDGWSPIWNYSEEYVIGTDDEIGYFLRLSANDGYSFSEATNIQLNNTHIMLESKSVCDNPFYEDEGNNAYLELTLNLGTGADIEEAINPSTQEPTTPPTTDDDEEPVTPPTTQEEYVLDIYEYGNGCVFKYLGSEYNEAGGQEWVEYVFGGFGTTLYAGQPIGTQIENDFKIETDPTREGATFEGWAKFKTERYENGNVRHTFVPQSDTKAYYTTTEMLNSEMPNYNVTFYPKWSDISIDEYCAFYNTFILNANGGQVTMSYADDENGITTGKSEITPIGVREGYALTEYLKKENSQIVSVQKNGYNLANWTVYQYEWEDVVEASELDKASNEMAIKYATYEDENGTEHEMYIVLNNYKLVSKAMTTADLYKLGATGNYYAVANWEKSVTCIENKELTESIEKEKDTVVDAIVKGTVTDNVVSKETAEKVKQAVETGATIEAEIVVYPVDEADIDKTTKDKVLEQVEEAIGKNAKVQFLDISILLTANGEEIGTLNELQEEISITMEIPSDMKVENAEYVVIRNHDGEISVLPVTVNADGTITFKTDRFSTYALAYADNSQASTSAPKTGDNINVFVYVALLCVAMCSVVLVLKKQRNF